MKKALIVFAAIVLTGCCKCVEDQARTQGLLKLIEAYEAHTVATEVLLDSIYMHDPNWFDDVLTEQDAHCDYVETRMALDSLR